LLRRVDAGLQAAAAGAAHASRGTRRRGAGSDTRCAARLEVKGRSCTPTHRKRERVIKRSQRQLLDSLTCARRSSSDAWCDTAQRSVGRCGMRLAARADGARRAAERSRTTQRGLAGALPLLLCALLLSLLGGAAAYRNRPDCGGCASPASHTQKLQRCGCRSAPLRAL
jgi:hypothetical protein